MIDYKIIQLIDVEIDGIEKRLYIPKIIRSTDIQAVSPLTTSKGKLFKNLSVFELYSDKLYIVIGNYIKHSNNIKNHKAIGFKGKNY